MKFLVRQTFILQFLKISNYFFLCFEIKKVFLIKYWPVCVFMILCRMRYENAESQHFILYFIFITDHSSRFVYNIVHKVWGFFGPVLYIYSWSIWQYRLWSFQGNQHIQRKSMNFENWSSSELSKIGHHFRK